MDQATLIAVVEDDPEIRSLVGKVLVREGFEVELCSGADELDRAVLLSPGMIGINSRNLKTMQVDLKTALRLAAKIPDGILKIAESGIKTHADITRLQAAGFSGFLVGESLMRQPDLGHATRNLLGRT